MRTATLRLPVVLAAALAFSVGCSSDDGTGPDGGISETQSQAVANEVLSAALAALASPAVGGSLASSALINWQYARTESCSGGGRMGVNGNLSGGIDDQTGTGQAWLQVLITFTDCIVGGTEVNGSPNLDLTGTFSFVNWAPSTQQTLRIGGALLLDGVFCAFNVTINYESAVGTATVSGTVCGNQINYP